MSVVKIKIQTVEDILPADLDGGSEQATDQSHLQGSPSVVLPSSIRPQSFAGELRVLLLSVWRRERKRIGAIGSPENGRCVVFENCVGWNCGTIPGRRRRHSRPASCVVEADIDAEDQPERDPQKGH